MILVHRNNVPHSRFAETKKRLILKIAGSKKIRIGMWQPQLIFLHRYKTSIPTDSELLVDSKRLTVLTQKYNFGS